MEQLIIQRKWVINLKKVTIVFAALFLILNSCHNDSKENIWKTERFHDYLLKIPTNCKLYLSSKNDEQAVISDGKLIDGRISGGDINIDLFEGYGYPTLFDADATSIQIKSIGSVKEKMQTYASGANKGLILICIWDTLKSTSIFRTCLNFNSGISCQNDTAKS